VFCTVLHCLAERTATCCSELMAHSCALRDTFVRERERERVCVCERECACVFICMPRDSLVFMA